MCLFVGALCVVGACCCCWCFVVVVVGTCFCWRLYLLVFYQLVRSSVDTFICQHSYMLARFSCCWLFFFCFCFSPLFCLLACLSAGLFVCWLEQIRQTIKVVDGKVDELVKLLMTMQSLIISTDAAFVLASTAISELRTSMKKVDVKVGVAQHADNTTQRKLICCSQKME